jgi:hypothetical protein
MESATFVTKQENFPKIGLFSSQSRVITDSMTLGFVVLMCLMLYMAYLNREAEIWIAESGWGYWFGLVGGSLMLLLLIYPLRKKWRVMHRWLPMKFWFRLHMIFGVLGPVLIMMHSSYRIGSMNGRVAFFSMLIVAISGLFGRYFYSRIHYGLYGKKATFESLRADSDRVNKKMGPLFQLVPEAKKVLHEFEVRSLAMPRGLIRSALHNISTRMSSGKVYRGAIHMMNVELLAIAKKRDWDRSRVRRKQQYMRRVLIEHRKTLRQMNGLHFYERLFAIWHFLHLPLFILLVVTGFIHVYAVHAY